MNFVTVTALKARLSSFVNAVEIKHDKIFITKNDRTVAMIAPIEKEFFSKHKLPRIKKKALDKLTSRFSKYRHQVLSDANIDELTNNARADYLSKKYSL